MKTLLSLGCIASLLVASVSEAQSPVLAEMYGRGVHQYFAGDLMNAHQSLTMAIDAGSDDPRAYYFRGLVNAATGREDEAKSDWKLAAQMESTSPMAGLVGQSLRRVQGSTRLQLEMVRQQTKLQDRGNAKVRAQARVQELRQSEAQVLRGAQPAAPMPAPSRTAGAAPAAGNPFARDDAATPAPATVAEDVHSDPFKDDAAGAPAAGGAAPAASGDAFGGSEPAMSGNDPFGGGAAPAAEPAAPAGGNMPDPFGAGFGSGT